MKLKLFYLTYQGCEWLEQTFEFPTLDKDVAKTCLDKYHLANEDTAKRLTKGWMLNDESERDSTLTLCCECDDKEIEKYLNNLIDFL